MRGTAVAKARTFRDEHVKSAFYAPADCILDIADKKMIRAYLSGKSDFHRYSRFPVSDLIKRCQTVKFDGSDLFHLRFPEANRLISESPTSCPKTAAGNGDQFHFFRLLTDYNRLNNIISQLSPSAPVSFVSFTPNFCIKTFSALYGYIFFRSFPCLFCLFLQLQFCEMSVRICLSVERLPTESGR